MITKEKVYEFVKAHECCVLATASSDGKPEAATMSFAVDVNLNFYFNTAKTTRKYPNLEATKKAAVVVGVASNEATIQIDGEVELAEGARAQEIRRLILTAHPEWESLYPDPGSDKTSGYFRVIPKRVCFSDFTQAQPVVEVVRI